MNDHQHRPRYHLSPPAHWMNDPNGMVYHNGVYHLFYQYDPIDPNGGPLKHWGHAVSTDLAHWTHLPVALSPDHLGGIWSGSAVVDRHNTSGHFADGSGFVALYTQSPDGQAGHQHQSIAFSADEGQTWIPYPDNPVIRDPGYGDFRDPKVIWHELTQRWVMVLAARDRVALYTSPNLIVWELASEFGAGYGAPARVWECPDLFPLCVDDDPHREKWVLVVSINGERGSAMQYFVGDFDGAKFTCDDRADRVRWVDYGRDCYAAVSWSDIPESDARRLWLGWMSNWKYARAAPTHAWRGAMTIPRELRLQSSEDGVQLVQIPAPELHALRSEAVPRTRVIVEPGADVPLPVRGNALEIVAEFEPASAQECGIRVHIGGGESTTVGYDVGASVLFVDRERSGDTSFHSDFPGIHRGPLASAQGRITMHIFVDSCSVEVFGNNGTTVITDLIFPAVSSDEIALYSVGGAVAVAIAVYHLGSIGSNNQESGGSDG